MKLPCGPILNLFFMAFFTDRLRRVALRGRSRGARRGSSVRDVYLGGSNSGSLDWRESEAIPVLKKNGLTFFRPPKRATNQFLFGGSCRRRLMPIEASAMDNSISASGSTT